MKIKDELTLKQMQEDAKVLSSAEIQDGIIDIVTIPLYILVPPLLIPMLIIKPIQGLAKILIPGSTAMRNRKKAMEVYQTFHPNASLTEVYNYVKKKSFEVRA